MLDVALWSQFPEQFVETKIQPGLEKRGIRVVKRLSGRTKDVDLSPVAAILYLHELAGHGDYDRITHLASSQGKKVIPLSRKESRWDEALKPLLRSVSKEKDMAQPRAISDSKLSEFCTVYMDLYRKGTKKDAMIPTLGKFWENGKLTNVNQLDQYIYNIVTNKRAPQFFQTWYHKGRKAEADKRTRNERAQAASEAQKLNEKNGVAGYRLVTPTAPKVITAPAKAAAACPLAPAAQPVSAPVVGVPKSALLSEKEALEQMLQEEADRYSKLKREQDAQLADMKAKMAEQNKILEVLRIENAKFKNQSPDLKLNKIVTHLVESVDLGIMEPVEAFKKLATFIKN